jgi:hypothetical protein
MSHNTSFPVKSHLISVDVNLIYAMTHSSAKRQKSCETFGPFWACQPVTQVGRHLQALQGQQAHKIYNKLTIIYFKHSLLCVYVSTTSHCHHHHHIIAIVAVLSSLSTIVTALSLSSPSSLCCCCHRYHCCIVIVIAVAIAAALLSLLPLSLLPLCCCHHCHHCHIVIVVTIVSALSSQLSHCCHVIAASSPSLCQHCHQGWGRDLPHEQLLIVVSSWPKAK